MEVGLSPVQHSLGDEVVIMRTSKVAKVLVFWVCRLETETVEWASDNCLTWTDTFIYLNCLNDCFPKMFLPKYTTSQNQEHHGKIMMSLLRKQWATFLMLVTLYCIIFSDKINIHRACCYRWCWEKWATVTHLAEFQANDYMRIFFYSRCQFDLNAGGGLIQQIFHETKYGKKIML